MTRLVPLVLLFACHGCDEPSERNIAVHERSEAVAATGTGAAEASATASARARPPRALCTKKPSGKPPESTIATAHAAGVSAPPTPIPFGAGKWIWINLWAAWCGPCKEEMPRLMRWQGDLRKAGALVDLAFVSLDDDERQLQRFLASQPANGLRASYWLEESRREKWLGALGISASATLPVHALVSPKGELTCIIHGALDDHDYPRIAGLLTGS
jgi:thiol-disulfide isomerase/thioredoxin